MKNKMALIINSVMDLLGAGGPQAPPLDPVDLKVEEILGEKNATVDGVLPLDANEISLK